MMQRPTRLKWPINPAKLTRLSCPEVGDVDCHSGVDFSAIEADGCPKAAGGHSGVDISAIEADGCPKAGGHSGVGISTRSTRPMRSSRQLRSTIPTRRSIPKMPMNSKRPLHLTTRPLMPMSLRLIRLIRPLWPTNLIGSMRLARPMTS